jgi:membrane peptidoglycan carboxypeptidase
MSPSRLLHVLQLVKRRRSRKAKRERAFVNKVMAVGAVLLGLVALVAAAVALLAAPVFSYLTQGLPSVERLGELLDPASGELLQPTRFYDRTGQQLLLTLDPPNIERSFADIYNVDLLNAFIASQDPAFWSRVGENPLRLDKPDGIAEDLVARLLLAQEMDGWAKFVRTRLLAADALARYGHRQVLSWALNSTSFGHWAFGAESAAQLYFGKGANDLDLAEAALLAAVAQAPALNPIDAPELAIEYQHLVLSAMRDQGVITDAQFLDAFQKPLEFAEQFSEPTSLAPDFSDLVMAQLAPALDLERIQAGGLDVTTTLDYSLQQELNANLATGEPGTEAVILDPTNGQILAMASRQTTHPAEAVLTAFDTLNLFAQGSAPASLIWTDEGPTTMRTALTAGKIPGDSERTFGAGLSDILHLQNDEGENQWTVLDAANAYSVFASGGLLAQRQIEDRMQPSALLFVGDAKDAILLNWTSPQLQAVTSPELAALVTDVLADASLRGEALSALGRPAAFVKLSESTGSWAIGFSPQRVIALWSERGAGQEDLWSQLFNSAHRFLPIKNWETPPGLVSLIVCVPSGLLPDDDCPQTRRELFVAGTEPTQEDALYERLALNSLNGKLATVFTAPEFVEERVFLMVPTEQRAWARRVRIPLPPTDFDTVPAFAGQFGKASVLEPAPFSEAGADVQIIAMIGDATHYDVQVGRGLYPNEWQLVAEGETTTDNQIEVEWNTEGLSGLWVIQVQAWDEAGHLARAYSVVTIAD